MKGFKPMLLPNNKTSVEDIKWSDRITAPRQWYVSEKYDGIRIELFFNENGSVVAKTRNLKPFESYFIKTLVDKLHGKIFYNIVLEGEIYVDGLNFNEIIHLINTRDITSRANVHKMYNLWTKSNAGTNKNIWPYKNLDLQKSISYEKNNIKIMLFDCYHEGTKATFDKRLDLLKRTVDRLNNDVFEIIKQHDTFESVYEIYQYYQSVLEKGGEGLVLKYFKNEYKFNRLTDKECQGFKMKDDNKEYTVIIKDVLEGTVVMDGVETTIDEKGYSRTSKSKFDREESGLAKGFLVEHKKYGEFIVTLKGFTNYDKKQLLINKDEYIGLSCNIYGMKPIRSVPRSAKYIKGKSEL